MILGFGVDVCEIARIRRALEGPAGDRFLARVFTEGERAYCEARRKTRFASYAARFAAKEAAMKALGTGWGQGVGWREFEEGFPARVAGIAIERSQTAGVCLLRGRQGAAKRAVDVTRRSCFFRAGSNLVGRNQARHHGVQEIPLSRGEILARVRMGRPRLNQLSAL